MPVLVLISTVARAALAAVWLISGVIKLADPGQTYVAVQAYDVLPWWSVAGVSMALPVVELVLGVLLAAGLFTRLATWASVAVLVVFVAGVTQAWARGLSIDCGCFGGGGHVAPGQTQYALDIAFDVGLLVLAGWLIRRPRTLKAADTWRKKEART